MEKYQSTKPLFQYPGEYIVCLHRKNNPRISVTVCEQNCRFKKRCKEYQTFFHLLSRGQVARLPEEAQTV